MTVVVHAWREDELTLAAADLARSPADGTRLIAQATFPRRYEHRNHDRRGQFDVAPDLGTAAYHVRGGLICCIDTSGAVVWERDLHPADAPAGIIFMTVAYDDAGHVWALRAFRRRAHEDHPSVDEWCVLDAATGAVLARAPVEVVGAGRTLAHPDGSVLQTAGEVHRGTSGHHGRMAAGRLTVEELDGPWEGRTLCDLSPSGAAMVSTGEANGHQDVRVHRYPDGEVLSVFTVEDLVRDVGEPDEPYISTDGDPGGAGFIDDDRLVVTIERGDDDVEHPHEVDWEVHVVVDLRTGGSAVLPPELGGDSTSIEPFGDGTYLTHGVFEEARHRLPDGFAAGRT
ncbi:hypothetical protein E1281_01415 [Actinomadura sp. KC345]|uniref:hypothetical protein n=1 Tax=Actinomadura sp. KC345 TaxID=2530371 RepID=UPI0010534C98|nr:hypothetical protein [Actinomadura sp. KC345]TDC58485.1 hypothetical protein E1281_01415 [Actinomadura sp. KC345]